ncbi:nuclear transport factor 2 family protein [Nocardia sp. NPDC050799]|uniref:nuclear transport factor 2 family protein n=1 Tax=Nocardia sp. NPDC050799 TaxID=3154842 RepID=UPI0033D95227
MSVEENKRIACELVQGLDSDHGDAAFDLLHESALWTVMAHADSFPVSGSMSKAEFVEHINRFRQAIPSGIRITVTGVTAEAARVAVEAESTATLPNGRILNQFYHFLFEIEDGTVRKAREYIDTAHGVAVHSG